jgi:hypothetical protein
MLAAISRRSRDDREPRQEGHVWCARISARACAAHRVCDAMIG